MIDRDTAVAARHHAADDRRHALRRLRPAAGLDHLHAAEPVPRGAGGRAGVSARTRRRSSDIYVQSRQRRAGAAERVHALRAGNGAAGDQSPGPVSGGDALVQPGARRLAGRGGAAPSNASSSEIGLPASIQASFQGTAQAFQASLANEPLLILAALVTVYIVLGVLYESYIHPITILSTLPSAGVGALLALLLCRQRPRASSR